MKTNKLIWMVKGLLILALLSGCEGLLQEFPVDQFSEQNIRNDQETFLRVLYDSYYEQGERTHTLYTRHDLTTDYMWQKFGRFNNTTQIYQDYVWNSLHGFFSGNYNRRYRGINRANFVLDNVDEMDLPQETKDQLKAEAIFNRAYHYDQLYDEFGPTPLVKTNKRTEYEIARATEAEMVNFIITEYQYAIDNLPAVQDMLYRATSGAAMGMLMKFYLNQKNWTEAANMAQQIINLGIYDLYPDYVEMFATSAEPDNSIEYIYAWSLDVADGLGNFYIGDAFPPWYSEVPPGVSITAAQWYVRDWLVYSFEENDVRGEMFITEYFHSRDQDSVTLLGNDKSACTKFTDDPDATGHFSGCDWPLVRYADVLLSRAEALNQMNGPNQESIDLMNQVRNRAGATPAVLADFSSTEQLRDTILMERMKEFFLESKRRQDLLRHDLLISNAQARGVLAAQSHHVRFPIPQASMDANSKLVQNPGY